MCLDIPEAFYKVLHNLPIDKLFSFVFDDNFSFLKTSCSTVSSKQASSHEQHSTPLEVPSVVLQGPAPGTLPFLLLLNYLYSIFFDAIAGLFAEDFELFFYTVIFQNDLTRRQNWNISYGMLAIVSKTRPMILRSSLDIANNTTLESGSKRKDLGVRVSSNLNWENHVDARFNRAR